ncbi:MAG TPA: acyl-CoA dehydrogenase family protein [Streptosporangiaceae bacterium]|nr:acyl-CoA dehydrogenase family protein [Streptosporangiaceae bacterium]
MDFTRSEAELEVSQLAARVLAARSLTDTGHRLAGALPNDPAAAGVSTDFDAGLWQDLARAGLLSLALPAGLGGDELGVQATAAVLTEVGRRAARVPALATLALGVLPVVRSADIGLKRQLLAGVASGDTVLTAAIREPSDPMPVVPRTVVTVRAGRPGTVSGLKIGVPYAAAASWILIPAAIEVSASAGVADAVYGGRTVVAVIEPDADGLSCQRTRSSSGLPEYTLRLEDTPVVCLLDGCDAGELYRIAVAGACAVADGVLAAALDLTTGHVRSREQFGRPLATFQAVAQQIADVYATARTVHLATVSACWQLDTGRDAGRDTDVAAYWLAEYGPRAMRTCHHLHGGLGMDVSYPLAGYSALMTDLVALVGGADDRLERLSWREQGWREQGSAGQRPSEPGLPELTAREAADA